MNVQPLWLTALALGVCAAAPVSVRSAGTADLLPLGAKAPAFTIPKAQGGSVGLPASSRGKKAVALLFWAVN